MEIQILRSAIRELLDEEKEIRVHIDIETYSEADLSKTGSQYYIAHPTTKLLLVAWKIENDPETRLWDVTVDPEMPDELSWLLGNPDVKLIAFNAPFERVALNTLLNLNIPASRYECVMVESYGMSFSGGLDEIGKQVGLPSDKAKLKVGKALIKRFCQPQPANRKVRNWDRHNDPEGWEDFKDYCIQDTVAAEAIHHIVKNQLKLPWDREYWLLDQEMNDYGLPVDIPLVKSALKSANIEKARLKAELQAKTGLDNPTSNTQMKRFLENYFKLDGRGIEIPNLQAGTLEDLMNDADRRNKNLPVLDGYIKEVLRDYGYAGRSSTSKFDKFLMASFPDDEGVYRIKGGFQFAGASRTNRYAGRIVQPQNFPRPVVITGLGKNGKPTFEIEDICDHIAFDKGTNKILPHLYDSPMGALSSSLRGMFRAPKGKKLVVADLAGIEGRVLPWLCFYEDKLDKIANGMDMYKVAANDVWLIGYDNIDKDQRQIGKVIELSLGYQGAVGAFQRMAKNYGVELPDAQVDGIVKKWRGSNKPIVDLWAQAQTAAVRAINNPGTAHQAGRLTYLCANDFLCTRLPSGRVMYYHKPRITGREITHMGQNQYSGKWERQKTYGGKLVQGACIAEGTLVLCESGWVPIEKVSTDTKVWDGVEWVSHDGVMAQGVKPVSEVMGVSMTGDHKVLTTEGWREADAITSQSGRFNRAPVSLPAGFRLQPQRQRCDLLGLPLRLWERFTGSRQRVDAKRSTPVAKVVWLLNQEIDKCSANYARFEPTPAPPCLGQHATAMPKSETSRLQKLWRTWGESRPGVVEFRELLAGCKSWLPYRLTAGSSKQRTRLQPRQHPMGDAERELPQYKSEQVGRNTERGYAAEPSCGNLQHQTVDVSLPNGSRVADGTSVNASGHHPSCRQAKTYDLINCGERTRFVVMDRYGQPLIVHNCQATARDVLAFWTLTAARTYGQTVIGTVHDEIICEQPTETAEQDLADMIAIVQKHEGLDWCLDLPLNAAGYVSDRYKKD